jgi:hypothetical protein
MLPRARRLTMPSSNDKLPPVSFDASCMAMIRCVLAVAALLVLALDPVAHLSFPGMAHLVLILYFASIPSPKCVKLKGLLA